MKLHLPKRLLTALLAAFTLAVPHAAQGMTLTDGHHKTLSLSESWSYTDNDNKQVSYDASTGLLSGYDLTHNSLTVNMETGWNIAGHLILVDAVLNNGTVQHDTYAVGFRTTATGNLVGSWQGNEWTQNTVVSSSTLTAYGEQASFEFSFTYNATSGSDALKQGVALYDPNDRTTTLYHKDDLRSGSTGYNENTYLNADIIESIVVKNTKDQSEDEDNYYYASNYSGSWAEQFEESSTLAVMTAGTASEVNNATDLTGKNAIVVGGASQLYLNAAESSLVLSDGVNLYIGRTSYKDSNTEINNLAAIRFGNTGADQETTINGNIYIVDNATLLTTGTSTITIAGTVTDKVADASENIIDTASSLVLKGKGYNFAGAVDVTGLQLSNGAEATFHNLTIGSTIINNGILNLDTDLRASDDSVFAIYQIFNAEGEVHNGFIEGEWAVRYAAAQGGTINLKEGAQIYLGADAAAGTTLHLAESKDAVYFVDSSAGLAEDVYYVSTTAATSTIQVADGKTLSHFHVAGAGTLTINGNVTKGDSVTKDMASILTSTTGTGSLVLTESVDLDNNSTTQFAGSLTIMGNEKTLTLGSHEDHNINVSSLRQVILNDGGKIRYQATGNSTFNNVTVQSGTGTFDSIDTKTSTIQFAGETSVSQSATLMITANWNTAFRVHHLTGAGALEVHSARSASTASAGAERMYLTINSLSGFTGDLSIIRDSVGAMDVVINTGCDAVTLNSLEFDKHNTNATHSTSFVFNVQADTNIGTLTIKNTALAINGSGNTLFVTESLSNTGGGISLGRDTVLDLTGVDSNVKIGDNNVNTFTPLMSGITTAEGAFVKVAFNHTQGGGTGSELKLGGDLILEQNIEAVGALVVHGNGANPGRALVVGEGKTLKAMSQTDTNGLKGLEAVNHGIIRISGGNVMASTLVLGHHEAGSGQYWGKLEMSAGSLQTGTITLRQNHNNVISITGGGLEFTDSTALSKDSNKNTTITIGGSAEAPVTLKATKTDWALDGAGLAAAPTIGNVIIDAANTHTITLQNVSLTGTITNYAALTLGNVTIDAGAGTLVNNGTLSLNGTLNVRDCSAMQVKPGSTYAYEDGLVEGNGFRVGNIIFVQGGSITYGDSFVLQFNGTAVTPTVRTDSELSAVIRDGSFHVFTGKETVERTTASSYYVAKDAILTFSDVIDGAQSVNLTGKGTVAVTIGSSSNHGNSLSSSSFDGVVQISKGGAGNGNVNLNNFKLGNGASFKLISGNHWGGGPITRDIELAGTEENHFAFRHDGSLELQGKVTGTYLTSGRNYGSNGVSNADNNLTLSGADSYIQHVTMLGGTLTVNADMFFGTVTAATVVIGEGDMLTLGGGTAETPVEHNIAKLSAASGSLTLGDYATLTLGGGTAEAQVTHNIGTLNGGTGSKLHLEANAVMETISTVTGSITVTGSGVYNMGSTVNSYLTGWTDSADWTGTVKLSGATFTGTDLSELINDASKIVFTDVTLNKSGDDVLKLAGQHGGSVEFYGTLSGEDGNLVVSGQGYSLTFNDNTSLWNGRIVADTSYAKVVYQGGETATAIENDIQIGGGNDKSTYNKLDVEFVNTVGMLVNGDVNEMNWVPSNGIMNLTVKNKDANASGGVQFNGTVGSYGKVNMTVDKNASAEFTNTSVKLNTVDVKEGATLSFAALTAQSVTNSGALNLGTAATITKAGGTTAATMSKVKMSSAGISGTAAGATLTDTKLSLGALASEASFTIKDMALNNVAITAANAETQVNLTNVTATDVQLAQGSFTMTDKIALGEPVGTYSVEGSTASFTTGQLNGITLNNAAGASLTVNLDALPESLTMGKTYDSLTIMLDGFTMNTAEGYEAGKGLIFAADSWLGRMLADQKAVYVNADVETATTLAANNNTVRVEFSSVSDGSNVGTVIRITGLTIPEPTTSTLSLLALAGLAARRRRQH